MHRILIPSTEIKHAFHALALDEHRGSFTPTLWYIPKTKNEALLKENRLVQCWFPGYHANIGGGTTGEGKDDNDIDEITFAWMCDLVKPYLTFDREAIKLIIPSKTDLPPVRFHMGKRTQTDPKIGVKKVVAKVVKQVELTASYGTSKLDDTYGLSWKAAGGDVRRQPGEIKPLGDESEALEDVETRECIHPCVAYREVYSGGAHRCPSLAPVRTGGWYYPTVDTKWEHRKGKDGNGFFWVKHDNVKGVEAPEIPQYVIPKYSNEDGIGSLERLLVPDAYLAILDEANKEITGNGLRCGHEVADHGGHEDVVCH
jgi:hypothetical protein